MILRKCKSLSRQLGRSSSYSSLRSKSTREELWNVDMIDDDEHHRTVFVGSTRKRYVISSKYLSHPLIDALIDKNKHKTSAGDDILVVKCEVVLFDHLLWMLENVDPNLSSECLQELAELYVFWGHLMLDTWCSGREAWWGSSQVVAFASENCKCMAPDADDWFLSKLLGQLTKQHLIHEFLCFISWFFILKC